MQALSLKIVNSIDSNDTFGYSKFANNGGFFDDIARIFPDEFYDDRSIRNVTFQVTDRCNLKCSYCYQIHKGTKVMKFEYAKKLIDLLLDSTKENNQYINIENCGGIVLDFIGGEPLLEIELIDKICSYFIQQAIIKKHPWRNRYAISIGSNGVLYFDEKVQQFLKKYNNKTNLNITIDGNKELHDSCRVFPDGSGSYDIAFKAAKDWMRVNGSINSKLTIAPENVMYLYDATIDMINMGYTVITCNCVYEEGWTVEHAKIYYDQLKKIADYLIDNDLIDRIGFRILSTMAHYPKMEDDNNNWCGGNGSMLAMDPDGYLYNCIRYMESSLGTDQPPMIIGHIDRGIGNTEQDKKCIECMKCIDRRSQSTDECYYCPIGEGCSWCSAYNYQVFGTPNKRATFICIMHKAEALANTYCWNKYFRKMEQTDPYFKDLVFKMYCPEEWAKEIISDEEYKLLLTLSKEV